MAQPALIVAAANGDLAAFDAALARNPDALRQVSVDMSKISVLHAAVLGNNVELVRAVLRQRPQLISAIDAKKNTPLDLSIYKVYTDVSLLLIAAGASVNRANAARERPLYRAVGNNDKLVIKALLEAGVPEQLSIGLTMSLMLAGNAEIIKMLLDAGADVNAVNCHHMPPIEAVIKTNNTIGLRMLLDAGFNVNLPKLTVDEFPLHAATRLSKPDIVEMLLEAGADVNSKNFKGHTPCELIQRECESPENTRIIALLEAAGADRTLLDSNSRREPPSEAVAAQFAAAIAGDLSAFQRALADHSASITGACDSKGRTILFAAIFGANGTILQRVLAAQPALLHVICMDDTPLIYTIRCKNGVATMVLIAAGADVNAPERSAERPPLNVAVTVRNMDAMRMLLAAGANVHGKTRRGVSALRAAAGNVNAPMVQVLVGAGARPNDTDGEGRTALHALIDGDLRFGRTEDTRLAAFRVLLDAGASLSIPSCEGITPLEMCLENVHLTKELLARGLDRDYIYTTHHHGGHLHVAAANTLIPMDVIRVLVDAGADVERVNEHGETPLFVAAQYKNDAMVKFLLAECGARIDAEDSAGVSVLQLLVRNNVSFGWAEKEFDRPEARRCDRNGNTLLHVAAAAGNALYLHHLVRAARVDVNARNGDGRTALHLAVVKDPIVESVVVKVAARRSVVVALLGLGAQRTVVDEAGATPLDLVRRDQKLLDLEELLTTTTPATNTGDPAASPSA